MKKPPRQPRKRTTAPRISSDLALGVAAALDKKAIDLVVLDLKKGEAFTDYFVICTAANARQVNAIADAIQEAIRKAGTKPALVEGVQRAEWVLDRLLRFHLPHLHTRHARVLRTRTAVGRCRAR